MEKRIKIITGQIRSGKTTFLQNLLHTQKNVGGILQISHGTQRFFVDTFTNEKVELTTESNNKNSFLLGKFTFDRSSFGWANRKLEIAIKRKNLENLVIDEYGPLEMKGEGFEPMFSKIINRVRTDQKLNLMVIVRKSLLAEFLKKFNLKEDEVTIEVIENHSSQLS